MARGHQAQQAKEKNAAKMAAAKKSGTQLDAQKAGLKMSCKVCMVSTYFFTYKICFLFLVVVVVRPRTLPFYRYTASATISISYVLMVLLPIYKY